MVSNLCSNAAEMKSLQRRRFPFASGWTPFVTTLFVGSVQLLLMPKPLTSLRLYGEWPAVVERINGSVDTVDRSAKAVPHPEQLSMAIDRGKWVGPSMSTGVVSTTPATVSTSTANNRSRYRKTRKPKKNKNKKNLSLKNNIVVASKVVVNIEDVAQSSASSTSTVTPKAAEAETVQRLRQQDGGKGSYPVIGTVHAIQSAAIISLFLAVMVLFYFYWQSPSVIPILRL